MEKPSRQKRVSVREAQQRARAQEAAAVIGVDAGKFCHCLVVRPFRGVDSRPFTFPTTREGFNSAVDFILYQAGGAPPEEILIGIEFAGVYGFTLAHYLNQQGFQIVSVLPADTKAWKKVKHRQRLKSDPKDAASITDLAAQGYFVSFPFLKPAFAELRCLVSARERVTLLQNAALTRLKSTMQMVFPEFEQIFKDFRRPTAVAVLWAFPGPEEVLAAPKSRVLRAIKKASRGHLGEETCERLRRAAGVTLAVPGSLEALKREVHLLLVQIKLYGEQIAALEDAMVQTMQEIPEAKYLLSIPGVAAVSAATFLGCLGDPQAYSSSRQILRLAGLSLVEDSSGTRTGSVHLSKHGRPLLRRYAFMLGLRAVRGKDGLYREQYNRILEKNGNKKMPAVIAVGREMLRLMFSIAQDKRFFTPEPPPRAGGRTQAAGQ